jgi:hypothetical protein
MKFDMNVVTWRAAQSRALQCPRMSDNARDVGDINASAEAQSPEKLILSITTVVAIV